MSERSVTFLFPGPGNVPQGGFKVVYEYANRFAADGWKVNIVYAANIEFRQLPAMRKLRAVARYFKLRIKGFGARSWFPLDSRVREILAFTLDYRFVPRSSIYVATAVQTAWFLNEYPIPKTHKFYLIQGYENWDVDESRLHATYNYGFHNLVVSSWLQKKLGGLGVQSELIPNGFDFNYFKLSVPIEGKNPLKVSMLYHHQYHKGASFGLEALKMVKEEYPELEAVLFGFPTRPEDLPEWISYYQTPDRETHNRIYNECAIYLAPSLTEGWGLTVGEAMICGAAVVCTDTPGFQEMVTDGRSALVCPTADSAALAESIKKLIRNPELRKRLANQAVQDIRAFTWESSYRKFRTLVTSNLSQS